MSGAEAGAQIAWAQIRPLSSMTWENFSMPEFPHLKWGKYVPFS